MIKTNFRQNLKAFITILSSIDINLKILLHVKWVSDCPFIKNEYEIRELIIRLFRQKFHSDPFCVVVYIEKQFSKIIRFDRTQQMVLLWNKLTPFIHKGKSRTQHNVHHTVPITLTKKYANMRL